MGTELGVGIVGCGNISATYLANIPLFLGLRLVSCADIDPAVADARSREFGLRADRVEQLLADPTIDIVVNLTPPKAHFALTKAAVEAGKHVYSEKPLALTLQDGEVLRELARAHGRSICAAPDTFLGGAHQQARAALDAGEIGTVVAATCHVMGHGMEHWHPNPDFFYKPGAGPVLDLGPYYIASLIDFMGPVRRVAGLASAPTPSRTIGAGPRRGQTISVETPTTIHALLDFACGATVTLTASWDVWAHRHAPMELYGTAGSLFLPDPDFFGGDVEICRNGAAIESLGLWEHPFAVPNKHGKDGEVANYRAAGLADMACAIRERRDARCSFERALHAVDIMTSILNAGAERRWIELATTCTRPAPLSIEQARGLQRVGASVVA